MIRAIAHRLMHRTPSALGMVLIDTPADVPLFTSAITAYETGTAKPIPLYDTQRPGDVPVVANGPSTLSPPCKYAQCPDGYQAFCQLCPDCSDSWGLCRKIAVDSTNGLPYAPTGGVGEGFWKEAVANAAASWYVHGHSNVDGATTNPITLQPWIDRANAWFWGVQPYVLGKGFELLGGGSSANQLPWNDVPWGAISSSAWLWLAAHATDIDWKAVRALVDAMTFVNPEPNADAPDVDWMEVAPDAVGIAESQQAWAKNTWRTIVPWATIPWTLIPWRKIPWASIDWPAIHTTNDLINVLSGVAATGTAAPPPQPGEKCAIGDQGYGVVDANGACVQPSAYPGDPCTTSDGRAGTYDAAMACQPSLVLAPVHPILVNKPGGAGTPPGNTTGSNSSTFGATVAAVGGKALWVAGGAAVALVGYRLLTKQPVVPPAVRDFVTSVPTKARSMFGKVGTKPKKA